MENQASIKIMNIRYLILALDEEPRFYRHQPVDLCMRYAAVLHYNLMRHSIK
ncbi:hypothetical protein MHL86_15910 [Brevibacillus laterosporus]|nr:hypothetical protein [Brevibacillus laterosporus]